MLKLDHHFTTAEEGQQHLSFDYEHEIKGGEMKRSLQTKATGKNCRNIVYAPFFSLIIGCVDEVSCPVRKYSRFGRGV